MMKRDLLSVEQLSVHFGGIHALSDVGFRIGRGELVALIGPNGAGKTTLLSAIAGSVMPTAGRVFFNAEDITGAPAHAVNARGIARTFQAAELTKSLSVRENVMSGGVAAARVGWLSALFPSRRSVRARERLQAQADELLDLVGLTAQSGQCAGALPAGQQRLLAIARAMASGADLLFLDEPGAGLNEVEKRQLVEAVRAVHRMNKTIVFIEHDMEVVGELAQRILVLDRGRLIADGLPDAVRDDPAVIAAYLGTGDGGAGASSRAPRPRAASGQVETLPKNLLTITGLSVRYGGVTALDQVALDVREGELVALVGANGAGKSTLLKTISRVTAAQAGSLRFDGRDLAAVTANEAVTAGISLVPEGRELFASLTVLDNLLIGHLPQLRKRGWLGVLLRSGADDPDVARRLRAVYALFPVLHERRGQRAGTLSGGQAQMLAIGRALMAEPRLLMLDEPSLGVAPQVVADIMRTLVKLRDQGITILLIEQNARAALQVADRGYVLAGGRVVAQGDAAKLLADPGILQAYLGGQGVNGAALAAAAPLKRVS